MAAILRSGIAFSSRRSRLAVASAILVSVIAIGFSRAHAGVIELSERDIPDGCAHIDTPGLMTIYVFHSIVSGATGCRFRIQAGPGMTMTYVSETHDFPMTIGDTQTGMTVCYDTCLPGPYYRLATLTYVAYGTSTCAELEIVPHPDAETVEEKDCNYQSGPALVQNLKVSAFSVCATCPPVFSYAGNGRPFDCAPLAVEQTTWGRVKALYR